MDFGEAIKRLKAGKRVQRPGWNGRGMFIALNDGGECGIHPFLMIKAVTGEFVPWAPSQMDILDEDWTEATP